MISQAFSPLVRLPVGVSPTTSQVESKPTQNQMQKQMIFSFLWAHWISYKERWLCQIWNCFFSCIFALRMLKKRLHTKHCSLKITGHNKSQSYSTLCPQTQCHITTTDWNLFHVTIESNTFIFKCCFANKQYCIVCCVGGSWRQWHYLLCLYVGEQKNLPYFESLVI